MSKYPKSTVDEFLARVGQFNRPFWKKRLGPASLMYYFDNTLERKGIKKGIMSGMMVPLETDHGTKFYVKDGRLHSISLGLTTYKPECCFNTQAEAVRAAKEQINKTIAHKTEIINRNNKQNKFHKSEIDRLTNELKIN